MIVLANPRRMPPRTKSGRFRKRKGKKSSRRRSTPSRKRKTTGRRKRRRSGSTSVSVRVRRNPRKVTPKTLMADVQRMVMKGVGLEVGAQAVRLADSWAAGYVWRRILPSNLSTATRSGLSLLLTTLVGSIAMRYVPAPRIVKDNFEDAGAFLALDSIVDPFLWRATRNLTGPGLGDYYSQADYGMIGEYGTPDAQYGVLGDWETELDAGMGSLGDYVTVPELDYQWVE